MSLQMKVIIPMEIKYKVMFERMRAKVRVDYETDCWNWTGALDNKGYGKYRRPAKWYGRRAMECAHRVMYEIYFGEVPESLQLDHLCRNRRCINPYHLEPVKAAENSRRGKNAKLTREQIVQIRRLMKEGVRYKEIADKFGISLGHVCNIGAFCSWRDVI